jgi:RNA polymerase I-specific transcription initiation factor RRN3
VAYIDNLKRVIEFAPELSSEVFALITERLVKIDVQMQVDFDELDDQFSAAIVQAISLQPNLTEEDAEEDDTSDIDSITTHQSPGKSLDSYQRFTARRPSMDKHYQMVDFLSRVKKIKMHPIVQLLLSPTTFS